MFYIILNSFNKTTIDVIALKTLVKVRNNSNFLLCLPSQCSSESRCSPFLLRCSSSIQLIIVMLVKNLSDAPCHEQLIVVGLSGNDNLRQMLMERNIRVGTIIYKCCTGFDIIFKIGEQTRMAIRDEACKSILVKRCVTQLSSFSSECSSTC